jgi:ABC-type multidrug transport system ATPase subunit
VLGPNGAGKTTMLSMATGLLQPDAGRALIHGIDVWGDPLHAKRMVGTLADGVDLFERSARPTSCACSTWRARPGRSWRTIRRG